MTSPAIDPAAAIVGFFSALPTDGASAPQDVAQAFAVHLAALDARKLPPSAQSGWKQIATRMLKAPAGKSPIPPRQVAAIASWPLARVTELIESLRAIAVDVERAANDQLADETNERVARAYL